MCYSCFGKTVKEEVLKDLKEVIIPSIVAEVIHRLGETEDQLNQIISKAESDEKNNRT